MVFDKFEWNLLGNGFSGDQKSRWKFFDGNFRKFIESTHLCWNCLMFLWSSCLWGNSRWNLGLKWGKWMIFSVYRISIKSSRIFSEFLVISTTLWLTWIDKNFSVCWTARLIWLKFENEVVEFLLVNVLDSRSLIAAGWPTVLIEIPSLIWHGFEISDFPTELKSTREKSPSTLDILKF